EPVQVGVLEPQRQAARLALAARTRRRRPGAQHQLAEPQCEPLLAHAGRAVEEQGIRQSVREERCGERGAQLVVALDGKQTHGSRDGGPDRERSQVNGSTGSMLPSSGMRTWNSMCAPSGVSSPPTVPICSPARTCWFTSTLIPFRYRY